MVDNHLNVSEHFAAAAKKVNGTLGCINKGITKKMIKRRTSLSYDERLREVVDSPTLDTFRIQLDSVLGHLVQTVLLTRKFGSDDP
ncbi:hypothetical protein BTVI_15672 [Pitangus sulphuratus]|nr:hypothetical protein BTVI_15672 [Pitangus sulphuratus]